MGRPSRIPSISRLFGTIFRPKITEKRLYRRFPVGAAFPFKATLCLRSRADHETKHPAISGWGVKVLNLSATGISLSLPQDADCSRGDSCSLLFSLGAFQINIPAVIAHFGTARKRVTCGLTLNFPDDETRSAYLQFLEPVMIAASITSTAVKTESRWVKEQYIGTEGTSLNVWRDVALGPLYRFDFHMKQYGVSWTPQMKTPAAYGPAPLTPDEEAEVHQLFSLSVHNLPEIVPADVVKFLMGFASPVKITASNRATRSRPPFSPKTTRHK